jgi:hypothetical protein
LRCSAFIVAERRKPSGEFVGTGGLAPFRFYSLSGTLSFLPTANFAHAKHSQCRQYAEDQIEPSSPSSDWFFGWIGQKSPSPRHSKRGIFGYAAT